MEACRVLRAGGRLIPPPNSAQPAADHACAATPGRTGAAYLNDTLVGAFAIALSILVQMMLGMAHHRAMMQPGPEIPRGLDL